MWGSKNWYSDEIKNRRNSPDKEYTKLNVFKDMWGLDFLYGHFFEYYFGTTKIGKHTVEMSVFQVSDDGYFISNRVGETGLFPVSTSHTTVRTVRYTAVH